MASGPPTPSLAIDPIGRPGVTRFVRFVVAGASAGLVACAGESGVGEQRGAFEVGASAADGADWAQFGRTPRHTSWNPFEATVVRGSVGALAPVWSCCERGASMDVAVWRGQVFVTNADVRPFSSEGPSTYLAAFDAVTGEPTWPVEAAARELSLIASVPTVGYGRVFVQAENDFSARASRTGDGVALRAELRRFPAMDERMSNPVAAGRRVYFDSLDTDTESWTARKLYAFAEDGAPLWQQVLPGGPREPAIANGRIWTVAGENELTAFELATGVLAVLGPTVEGVLGSPAILGGRVYALASPNTLHAFDEDTGLLLWSAPYTGGANVPNPAPPPPPAVDDRHVYVATDKSSGGIAVGAFDGRTGRRSFSVIVGTGARSGQLAVAGGVVYVPSSDGHLYAIDRDDGALLASFAFGAPVRSPAVVGGRVYVPTRGAGMTALGVRRREP